MVKTHFIRANQVHIIPVYPKIKSTPRPRLKQQRSIRRTQVPQGAIIDGFLARGIIHAEARIRERINIFYNPLWSS